jgi:phosphatidylglycerol:prolipoprotein diacylglycerol transferase
MPNCPLCLAIVYTNPNDLLPADLKGVPTYAYPAYEILAEIVLLGVLWLFRKRLPRGYTFLLAAIGYAVIRFGLTYLRQETVIAFGLQEAQVIALITAAAASAMMARRWRFAT